MLPRDDDFQPSPRMLKNLLRHPAVLRVLASLLGRYLLWALRTTRWELVGAEHFAPYENGAPVICAFWHEHLPLMSELYLRVRAKSPQTRAHVLVSRHNDGRFIGDVVAKFGLSVAYGSTARGGQARGGAAGAMTLLDALENGDQVVITPDGPRGPRRKAAPGVARLASLSGLPILPAAARTSPCKILSSWDRMILPFPYARGVLVVGAAIHVPQGSGIASLPMITRALNEVAEEAERQCR
jgi:lysophospholipid acyltransferase (LPLAT)-like uncharacterized protein